MAVSEESRHKLYGRLDEVLGSDEATTLIEHLPPVGWADVATKRDLEQLKYELVARFDRELRVMTWRLVTAMIAVASVVVAAVRL